MIDTGRYRLMGSMMALIAVVAAGCETETPLRRVSGAGFFDPEVIEFGTRSVGLPHELPAVFSNTSQRALLVSSLEFEPPRDVFVVRTAEGATLRGSQFARGASVDLNILYRPIEVGNYDTDLVVVFDDFEVVLPIKAAASMVAPAKPRLDPSILDFGRVEIGRDVARPVLVKNIGAAPGRLKNVLSRTVRTPFFATGPSGSPLELPSRVIEPEEEIVVEIHFKPTAEGMFSGDFELSFDSNETAILPVSGSAIEPGVMTCVPALLDFGQIPRGQTEVQTVGCSVTGGPFELTGLRFLNGSSSSYTIPNPPAALDAQRRLSFNVQFESLGLPGRRDGAIELSSAHGTVTRVTLVGETISPVPGTGDINVTMTWNTPYSDFDLHLVRGSGNLFEEANDCFFASKAPDWGVSGYQGDNPFLDQDETAGYGPEQINLSHVAETEFHVYVMYYNYSRDFAPATTVTVATKIQDQPESIITKDMFTCGDTWYVGRFDFSGAQPVFIPVDVVSDSWKTRASQRCQ